jgi:hypothetical protein
VLYELSRDVIGEQLVFPLGCDQVDCPISIIAGSDGRSARWAFSPEQKLKVEKTEKTPL